MRALPRIGDHVSVQATLLCPVDFSALSRGALHYALAIARRFHARLVVQTVDDPLLAEVGDTRLGEGWSRANSEVQLRSMVAEAEQGFPSADVIYDVRLGKPAPVILETARDHGCALIVMSTHGRSGVGKFLFGAVAERVLREASTVIAAIDLGPSSARVLYHAAGFARLLSARLEVLNVSGELADKTVMAIAFQRLVAIVVLALVSPVALQARQQVDAAVIVQFQRAADSYAFQHRQAERRGVSPASLIEGAFFTPQAAAAFRHRIRVSGCAVPQPSDADSVVPRPSGSIEGTRPPGPCLSAVLPALPAELEYRVRGVALLLADAHLHVVVDVLHAAFSLPNK
jgi:universal stress protein A